MKQWLSCIAWFDVQNGNLSNVTMLDFPVAQQDRCLQDSAQRWPYLAIFRYARVTYNLTSGAFIFHFVSVPSYPTRLAATSNHTIYSSTCKDTESPPPHAIIGDVDTILQRKTCVDQLKENAHPTGFWGTPFIK